MPPSPAQPYPAGIHIQLLIVLIGNWFFLMILSINGIILLRPDLVPVAVWPWTGQFPVLCLFPAPAPPQPGSGSKESPSSPPPGLALEHPGAKTRLLTQEVGTMSSH